MYPSGVLLRGKSAVGKRNGFYVFTRNGITFYPIRGPYGDDEHFYSIQYFELKLSGGRSRKMAVFLDDLNRLERLSVDAEREVLDDYREASQDYYDPIFRLLLGWNSSFMGVLRGNLEKAESAPELQRYLSEVFFPNYGSPVRQVPTKRDAIISPGVRANQLPDRLKHTLVGEESLTPVLRTEFKKNYPGNDRMRR